MRGGNWNNGAGAGVFALNLNNPRAISNSNVGFRAASPPQPDIQSLRALFQRMGDKGICPLAERDNPKSGTGRRFLCAAAPIGVTLPGLACSRSGGLNRARTRMSMLVSAPLYPRCQMRRAYGPSVSAEGIKGPVPMPCPNRQKTKPSWKPLVTRPVTG